MKQYLILSLLLILSTQRETCVNLGCACVTESMSHQVAVRCSRDTIHCYERSQCLWRLGECRYTRQWWIDMCITRAGQSVSDPCTVGGCNDTQCVRRSQIPNLNQTSCPKNPFAACYVSPNAICQQQSWGQCGWTLTSSFRACWANILLRNN
jgi:hypothetical protein